MLKSFISTVPTSNTKIIKELKSNECEVKSGKVIFFQPQIKASCDKNLLQNFSNKLRAIVYHA